VTSASSSSREKLLSSRPGDTNFAGEVQLLNPRISEYLGIGCYFVIGTILKYLTPKFQAILMHYDLGALYSNWVTLAGDTQRRNNSWAGAIGDYAPDTVGNDRGGNANWGSGYPTVAHHMWWHYGDAGLAAREMPRLEAYNHGVPRGKLQPERRPEEHEDPQLHYRLDHDRQYAGLRGDGIVRLRQRPPHDIVRGDRPESRRPSLGPRGASGAFHC
jgi:hypothetical protein